MTWDVVETVSTWDRVETRVLEVVDTVEEAQQRMCAFRGREDRPIGATISIRPSPSIGE